MITLIAGFALFTAFISLLGTTLLYLAKALPASRTTWVMLPIAPVFGLGALSATLALYSLLQIPWTAISLSLPWMLVICYAAWRFIKSGHTLPNPRQIPLPWKLSLGAFGLITSGLIIHGLANPFIGWDGIAMWIAKGKLFYLNNNINPFDFLIPDFRHLDYPPFYSLCASVLFVFFGTSASSLVQPLNITILASLAAALAAFIYLFQQQRSAQWLLLITGLFMLSPIFTKVTLLPDQSNYADLFMGCLFGMIVILTLLLPKLNRPQIIAFLSLICLLTLTKNEGLLLVVVPYGFALLQLVRAKDYRLAALSLLTFAPIVIWKMFIGLHNYSESDYSFKLDHVVSMLQAIGPNLNGVYQGYLHTLANNYFVALPVIILLYLGIKALLKANYGLTVRILVFTLIAQIAFYNLAYLLFATWVVKDMVIISADRLVVGLAPAIFVLMMVMLSNRPQSGKLK